MTARTAQRIDAVDEAQLLQTIDRWLERDVKPIVRKYDHDDLYPAELVEQMKALGLFGATISQRLRRARPACDDLCEARDADLRASGWRLPAFSIRI